METTYLVWQFQLSGALFYPLPTSSLSYEGFCSSMVTLSLSIDCNGWYRPSIAIRIEKIMDHRIFSSKYFCVFTTCWKPVNSTLPKPGRRTKSFWKWKTITTRDWNSTASGATRFCFPTQHREGTTFRVSGSTRSGVGGTSCARHWSEPAPGERSFRASQDSRFGGQHLLNTRNV